MLRLYGHTNSRALLCMWMLYEMDEPFELVRVYPHSSELLPINPNGKIPALVDGDAVLWESLAINLYLAQTRTTSLSPRGQCELGDVLKWTLWAQSELAEYFGRTTSLDNVSAEWVAKTIGVMESTLKNRQYLIADRFTVADLNVNSIFWGPVASQLSLDRFPAVEKWREACWNRPAAARAIAESLDPDLH